MPEPETKITLAPASGDGFGKEFFDRLLAEPDFMDLMIGAARDGLRAMSPRRWDKESGQWLADPDCRTRVQTLFGLMAHGIGEPVKRIIHQHLGAGGKLDVGAALTESPELTEAVRRELQKAEWKHSGHQAHKRPKKVTEAAADGDGMQVG